jgi:uncharacterized membrane protein
VVSTVLLWQHRAGWGAALHYGLPLLGSYMVLRRADVQRLRRTRRGQYVLAHMPPTAQAVRLAGDAVMAYGSWHQRPSVIVAGLGIVAAGWSAGMRPGAARVIPARTAAEAAHPCWPRPE